MAMLILRLINPAATRTADINGYSRLPVHRQAGYQLPSRSARLALLPCGPLLDGGISVCGRFATPSGAAMQKVWHIEDVDWDAWVARYNVAPTQTVPMVVHCRKRVLSLFPARWGLIPS